MQTPEIRGKLAVGVATAAFLVGGGAPSIEKSFEGTAYAQAPAPASLGGGDNQNAPSPNVTGGSQAQVSTDPSATKGVENDNPVVHRGPCADPEALTQKDMDRSSSCGRFLLRTLRKISPIHNKRDDLAIVTAKKLEGDRVTSKMTRKLATLIMRNEKLEVSSPNPGSKGQQAVIEKERQLLFRTVNGEVEDVISISSGIESKDIRVKGEETETPTGNFKIVAIHGMGYDNGLMDDARMISNREFPLSRGFGLHQARRDDPVVKDGRQSLGCIRLPREDALLLKKFKLGNGVTIRERLPEGRGIILKGNSAIQTNSR